MSGSLDPLPTEIEAEVRLVIEHYRVRFNDGDADGLAQLYAPDIWFVNLGGVPFIGRPAIRDQQARGFLGPLNRITVELEMMDARAMGVDYVLVLIRQTIGDRSTADGSTSASTMAMVLDRSSGSWLIRHLQNTPVQRPWAERATGVGV